MAQKIATGLFQFCEYTIGEAAVTTGVQTGGDLTINPQPRQRNGIGGTSIRRGGLIVPSGNAEFYLTATNLTLLTAGLRASYPKGALTGLDISGGMNAWSRDYGGAVIEEFGLNYSRDEGLKANVKWGALSVAEGAGGTQAAVTDLDFEDHDFTITVGGKSIGVSNVEIKGKNNVSWRSNGDAKVAGSIRMPTHCVYGLEELTVDITADLPFAIADLGLLEDDLPDNLGCVLTGSNGVSVCTITLTNLMPGENSHGYVDANTAADYKQSFIGDPAAGSLAIAITAEAA